MGVAARRALPAHPRADQPLEARHPAGEVQRVPRPELSRADTLCLRARAEAHRGEFHVVLAVNVHEAVSGLWLVCIPVWRVWACSVLLVIVCGVSIISDNRTI